MAAAHFIDESELVAIQNHIVPTEKLFVKPEFAIYPFPMRA